MELEVIEVELIKRECVEEMEDGVSGDWLTEAEQIENGDDQCDGQRNFEGIERGAALAGKAVEFLEWAGNEKTNCVFRHGRKMMVLVDLPSMDEEEWSGQWDKSCSSSLNSIATDKLTVFNNGTLYSVKENLVASGLNKTSGSYSKGDNLTRESLEDDEGELARHSMDLFGLVNDENPNRIFHRDGRVTILVDLSSRYNSNLVGNGSISQNAEMSCYEDDGSSNCSIDKADLGFGSISRRSRVLHTAKSISNWKRKRIMQEIKMPVESPLPSSLSGSELPSFACNECEKKYYHQSALNTHKARKHDGEKKLKCQIERCDKTFCRNIDLQSHKKTHLQMKPFLCYLCSNRFRDGKSLGSHINQNHRKEVNKMLIKDSASHYWPSDNDNAITSDPLSISIEKRSGEKGGENFTTEDSGTSSNSNNNDSSSFAVAVASPQDNQVLADCNIIKDPDNPESFGTRGDGVKAELIEVEVSLIKQTKDSDVLKGVKQSSSSNSNNSEEPMSKQHYVTFANEFKPKLPVIPNPMAVLLDGKKASTNLGEKPYSCEICGRGYYSNGALNVHMRTHTQRKIFLCQLCAKSFHHKAALGKHLKTHLKDFQ